MAYSTERRARLAALDLPSEEHTAQRIRRFLLHAGLSMTEFCQLIGHDQSNTSKFMNGVAKFDTRSLRHAAKQFLDLHELAEQDRLHRPHYQTRGFQEIRAAALNALKNGVAYIVDGPPGTEKTESFRRIEREVNTSGEGRVVYVYSRINHSPKQFLSEICASAGVPNNGLIDQLIRKLRFFLGAKRVLLIVDEAQHLGTEGLEVLRQLLDLPPYFGVLLGGSHDLTTRLQHWQMEQWRSRVRKSILLTGPTNAECREILRAELGELSDEDCDSIVRDCQSTGERVEMVSGKARRKQFTYTSARDLFSAIEVAQQSLSLVPLSSAQPAQAAAGQKESAA